MNESNKPTLLQEKLNTLAFIAQVQLTVIADQLRDTYKDRNPSVLLAAQIAEELQRTFNAEHPDFLCDAPQTEYTNGEPVSEFSFLCRVQLASDRDTFLNLRV